MYQVLKKRSASTFGAFAGKGSPSSSVSSSTGKAAKMLLGGTKGLVVTKKRKRSGDHSTSELHPQKRKLAHATDVKTPEDEKWSSITDIRGGIVNPSFHTQQISTDDLLHEKSRTKFDKSENTRSTKSPVCANKMKSAISENSSVTESDNSDSKGLRDDTQVNVESSCPETSYSRTNGEGDCGNGIENVNSTQRKRINADDADTTAEVLKLCDPKPLRTSDISTTCHTDESTEYTIVGMTQMWTPPREK